jgi:tetratricopeptide (TPR) repeat protein
LTNPVRDDIFKNVAGFEMDYKKAFERFKEQNVFVKTTISPLIDDAQKVALNRKGNILYNQGDIEGAKRVFLTTGYSDGLSRIGDYYKSKGRILDALRMYWIAPDHTKSELIIEQLSFLIKNILQEEKEDHPK